MNTTNSSQQQNIILELKSIVEELPRSPGIYKFLDSKDKVIYVGKAKNLRNRVKSYFYTKLEIGSKTATLVSHVRSIEHIETFSEFEALILEAELIKEYRPKYNIILKDDKSYIYIVIRPEKVKLDDSYVSLPVVIAARQTDLKEKDVSFGPYPEGSTAKSVVRIIRKAFPYRDCSVTKFNKYNKLKIIKN